ncbi:MAG: hypothetical protein NZL89_07410 [Leptospiraceae bacterium]|nr:hypothetical protein [Leptospiraceae bacterium]
MEKPKKGAEHWQKHQREIMRFAARFLRLKMRNPIRRVSPGLTTTLKGLTALSPPA